MKRTWIVFAVMIFLTTSCFYVDSEQFRVGISSEYSPEITFTSNINNNDSLSVPDSLLFRYTVAIDSGSLYFSDVYLGNLLLMRSDTVTDSLWIHPYFVNNNGNYRLTLVSYFKSYSGSLADIMDAEFITADTSWVINIIREEVK